MEREHRRNERVIEYEQVNPIEHQDYRNVMKQKIDAKSRHQSCSQVSHEVHSQNYSLVTFDNLYRPLPSERRDSQRDARL